jgi:mannose-1-phosphate guanylyltransferase
MNAMILAAGLGTRLRPLTDELPKPLVPVGDAPAVAHIAARLASAGIRAAALNTHHLADAFTPARLAALPIALRVIHEPEILGTAGGVANARDVLGDGDVLVWNGDILADLDVRALVAAHHASGDAATLVVARGADEIGLGADGRLVRLRGKRFGDEAAGAKFLGVYLLSARLRERLPRSGCMAGDVFLPALAAGERLGTFTYEGSWEDIGTIESYLAANRRWLAQRGRDAFVHESARVAPGVEVRGSVIGAGAIVGGSGAVVGSVIWPGARAEAPLAGAVVTPRGAVVHPR